MTWQDDYQRQLRQRQKEHLAKVAERRAMTFQPCAHDQCSECVGTGVKLDGSPCIHGLACKCRKCSPYSMSLGVPYSGSLAT